MNETTYNIGLSLSGGGAKGIAHLGVIQALEEFGLKPEIIAGVSAGSIIGALYADGKRPKDICRFFKESSFFKFVSISPNKGLMSSKRFYDLLDNYLTSKTFEDLKLPLIINATELIDGKNVYFTSGSLTTNWRFVWCTIFSSRRNRRKMYVVGGIFCNNRQNYSPKCQTLIGITP